MYAAELHGKVPSGITRMEDILASNVFSFFKYANREIFLKGYLDRLGFKISSQEAIEAELIFWPRYEEKTEPDLVILTGNYYLLIEAKYLSDFGGETEKTKAQLTREIEGGMLEARNYNKNFRLIAITADYIYKKNKFKSVPECFSHYLTWTNWQQVSSFLNDILNNNLNLTRHEREFALDLYKLLDRKNLRGFKGFAILNASVSFLERLDRIFFEAKTARFRGAFIGFLNSLSLPETLYYCRRSIFFSHRQSNFTSLLQSGKLNPVRDYIFYEGEGRGNHGRERGNPPADSSGL
ncbi:hypothetical protein HKBW3S03_00037 [Candidatus Hakubella thermalkaliphila]|uniref:NERD domain-containing protein n=3 Tax=Candidatus Hakubella thermalkaliphila TaxID=2754717 RepID=A0A6V8Q3C3_9ACTN|nr:hypothetical protein [Candidatus Hakubella thermalkaliphila]MBT9168637.1 hypothetical protein [Bacillota bacterium]GFP18532.1 hypothetical protein HKBW3S03_00037 [Candidatus Hakubella thermalkaliphila]GFP37421.1 hypothetical protein HKBW3S44_01101 [Candidatus Hakubella thermalkaliphila]GFP40239.1 hypothetical protein HKBW3S47_01935 [Candidatus Hakubella thermalkaliphila]GFP43687.1 hypothetical protein HKBW3C_02816 [Candidatus Hakubella thermalkaliphila]